jgi:2-oxoglutarate dehydrogenase complex dehydrogenase (E1) component-like enzyme
MLAAATLPCACPQVTQLLASRLSMVADADSRVDWAMAEQLAIGTLLLHRCNMSSHGAALSACLFGWRATL